MLFMDNEQDDASPLVESFYSLLNMHSSIDQKLRDSKRPKIIRRDCTKLRNILISEDDSADSWSLFRDVGDQILSGRFSLDLYSNCPLL